jgi:hypothetical protein
VITDHGFRAVDCLLFHMILSIHIPKTAGTTFRELLQKHYGPAICLHYYHPMDHTGRALAEIPKNTKCLHGHFTARRFQPDYTDALLITWMRHPIERVASEYEHLKRSPDPASGLSQLIAKGASLLDFAEHAYARNTQARYFDGMAPETFTFVGISEMFDRELLRLQATLDIPLPHGHRSNVNPAKTSPLYPLTADEREHLRILNQEDFALYRACVERATLPRFSSVLAA